MAEVYVLWWRYSDGSSCGVVRAYKEKARAQEDMDLLEDSFTSKDYKLEALELRE